MGHNFDIREFGEDVLMFCCKCGRTYILKQKIYKTWVKVEYQWPDGHECLYPAKPCVEEYGPEKKETVDPMAEAFRKAATDHG